MCFYMLPYLLNVLSKTLYCGSIFVQLHAYGIKKANLYVITLNFRILAHIICNEVSVVYRNNFSEKNVASKKTYEL